MVSAPLSGYSNCVSASLSALSAAPYSPFFSTLSLSNLCLSVFSVLSVNVLSNASLSLPINLYQFFPGYTPQDINNKTNKNTIDSWGNSESHQQRNAEQFE